MPSAMPRSMNMMPKNAIVVGRIMRDRCRNQPSSHLPDQLTLSISGKVPSPNKAILAMPSQAVAELAARKRPA